LQHLPPLFAYRIDSKLSLFTYVFIIEKYITCGSVVKLQHVESGAYLHSEEKNMGGGSGQQIVTWIPQVGDTSNLWWIREGNDDKYCVAGSPIQCGDKIRLTHLDTMRNLHTHNVQSPLSRQQEVSGFGQGDGQGDTGDDWILECSTGNWKRGANARLRHVDTNKYLGGSSTVKFTAQNCGGGCPIMNHLESFARGQKDDYSNVKVEMGIHLSK
jgi:dolichyl-phosphate-mannose--protein O-mannosyl transferase